MGFVQLSYQKNADCGCPSANRACTSFTAHGEEQGNNSEVWTRAKFTSSSPQRNYTETEFANGEGKKNTVVIASQSAALAL